MLGKKDRTATEKGVNMTSLRDELQEHINSVEEGVEIPEELLDIVSGGVDTFNLGDKKFIEGAVVFHKKILGVSCERAMEFERDEWGWSEERLQIMRDIWDEVK